MKVYREVSASFECKTNTEAWERVIKHQAPRFYVCVRRAAQYILPMTRGDRSKINHLSPLRREMYEELFKILQRLWQEEKYLGKPMSCVLRAAIQEPAPRFYIDIRRMGQIWQENRDVWRAQRKRLQHDE